MRAWLMAISILSWSSITLAGEVKVAVAANFASTFEQIAKRFKAVTGHRAIATVDSSGALYAQIMRGAPYELFLSADAERPIKLVMQGRAVAGTCQHYAMGRLILWSRSRKLVDESGALLKSAFSGTLAVANPILAPYGVAAQQTLENLGQWHAVQMGLVRGQNDYQTYKFATNSGVDAAFISQSRLQNGASARKGYYWVVPQSLYDPIDQHMVLLERGKDNPIATALLEFIVSDEGRRIIIAAGYGE